MVSAKLSLLFLVVAVGVAEIRGQVWYDVIHRNCTDEVSPGIFLQLQSNSPRCMGSLCSLRQHITTDFKLSFVAGLTSPGVSVSLKSTLFGQDVTLLDDVIPDSHVDSGILYGVEFLYTPSLTFDRRAVTVRVYNTQGGQVHVCGIVDIEVLGPIRPEPSIRRL